jgi:rubrerythrin
MSIWAPEDISWNRFDRTRVDTELVKLIKAASIVEHNAVHYARYLRTVFRGDDAMQQLAWEWAQSEVQHGQVLSRWATLADPDFDFGDRFRRFVAGYYIPTAVTRSIRGSLTGELLARCVVEIGTSSYYTAIGRATNEPVLKELCGRIAADELRHYKTFYELSRRYLKIENIGIMERLRVVVERVIESEDDELAYAYHSANESRAKFNRLQSNRAYSSRAYKLYSLDLVERVAAMLLKVVGLRPHGWLSSVIARVGHSFMQRRVRRCADLCVGEIA